MNKELIIDCIIDNYSLELINTLHPFDLSLSISAYAQQLLKMAQQDDDFKQALGQIIQMYQASQNEPSDHQPLNVRRANLKHVNDDLTQLKSTLTSSARMARGKIQLWQSRILVIGGSEVRKDEIMEQYQLAQLDFRLDVPLSVQKLLDLYDYILVMSDEDEEVVQGRLYRLRVTSLTVLFERFSQKLGQIKEVSDTISTVTSNYDL